MQTIGNQQISYHSIYAARILIQDILIIYFTCWPIAGRLSNHINKWYRMYIKINFTSWQSVLPKNATTLGTKIQSSNFWNIGNDNDDNVVVFRSARTSCTTSDSRGPVCAKNLDQLYSYINHHRTTTNLSDIVWCMSGGADAADALLLLMRWCCWCTAAADALLLLMHCCCGCTDAADVLMLLMRWCGLWCWCTDAVDALMLLILLMN